MAQIVAATDEIFRVELDSLGELQNTHAYLLRGDVGAVIDTGHAKTIPELLEALRLLNWQREDIAYIIPTHLHLDHAGGAGRLSRELPRARVVAHTRGARHLIDPAKLIEGTREAFGANFEKQYGAILPIPAEQVVSVEGGEVLDLGGRELEIYYAPGHAPHHIVIKDRKTGSVFCGDALGEYYLKLDLLVPVMVPPVYDVQAAKGSMELVRRLRPTMLLFGHGGASKDIDGLIDSLEKSVDTIWAIAQETFEKGPGIERLARELQAYHMRLVAERAGPHIPEQFRNGLNQDYDDMAKALLAYYQRINTPRS